MPMIFTDGQDPSHPVVFANEAFLRLTGFGRAAIICEPLSTLLGSLADAGSISSIQRAMAKGGSGTWEMQCLRADKTEFLAAVFLSPVLDEHDVIRQHFFSFVETGAHAERLVNQRNEMQALYELAPGFIATTTGPENRFSFANASFKRFVGKEQIEGLPVADALPEIIGQGFIGVLDDVYRTGEPFIGRSVPIGIVNSGSGKIEFRYGDFVCQAVRDANNKIIGLFCEGYDVTARREVTKKLSLLQAKMIHVSRVNAMGAMAAALAHELNQPLTAISNYAVGMTRIVDLLPEESRSLKQGLQGIEEASQRAAAIIRNLREQTRRREPERSQFDLKPAVAECVRLVRATVPPNVQITENIPKNLAMIADRVQIQQVIINLVINACDSVLNSERRQVSIVATKHDSGVLVRVIDSGVGVSVKAAERIFSWSGSTKETGMGLGLSICRTIIEAHRGRIWLENSGQQGSEFCFKIPLP
jgi:two-component system sensor kinase FixL